MGYMPGPKMEAGRPVRRLRLRWERGQQWTLGLGGSGGEGDEICCWLDRMCLKIKNQGQLGFVPGQWAEVEPLTGAGCWGGGGEMQGGGGVIGGEFCLAVSR